MARTYISSASLWMKHNISYQFNCEHCGKKDITVEHEIYSRAGLDGGNVPNSEKEREERLFKNASFAITNWIRNMKNKSAKGNNSFLKGKCPHCNKYQTWSMLPKTKSSILLSSLIKLIFHGIIGASIAMCLMGLIPLVNNQFGLDNEFLAELVDNMIGNISNWLIRFGVFGFIIVGFTSFIITFNKLSKKYKQYNDDIKDVKAKQNVEINWNENIPFGPIPKSVIDEKYLETSLVKKDRTEDNMTIVYN